MSHITIIEEKINKIKNGEITYNGALVKFLYFEIEDFGFELLLKKGTKNEWFPSEINHVSYEEEYICKHCNKGAFSTSVCSRLTDETELVFKKLRTEPSLRLRIMNLKYLDE